MCQYITELEIEAVPVFAQAVPSGASPQGQHRVGFCTSRNDVRDLASACRGGVEQGNGAHAYIRDFFIQHL